MESGDDCLEGIESGYVEDGIVLRRDSYHEEGESCGRLIRFCPSHDGECDSSFNLDGVSNEPNQWDINGLEPMGRHFYFLEGIIK